MAAWFNESKLVVAGMGARAWYLPTRGYGIYYLPGAELLDSDGRLAVNYLAADGRLAVQYLDSDGRLAVNYLETRGRFN